MMEWGLLGVGQLVSASLGDGVVERHLVACGEVAMSREGHDTAQAVFDGHRGGSVAATAGDKRHQQGGGEQEGKNLFYREG